MESNTLVAYFSATQTTAIVAKKIVKLFEADEFEIEPEIPYSREDLNWMDKGSRSSREMDDLTSRPEMKDKELDMSKYDTVLLGFPIWWYREPSIVDTFIDHYDLTGKKVILFATSGSSGFGKTVKGLEKIAPGVNFTTGRVLNGAFTDQDVMNMIK